MPSYQSKTPEIKTPCGTMHVTISFHKDGSLHKILPSFGKSGACLDTMFKVISYSIKKALTDGCSVKDCPNRCKLDTKKIVAGMSGHVCHNQDHQSKSCLDSFAKLMEKELI